MDTDNNMWIGWDEDRVGLGGVGKVEKEEATVIA